MYTLSIRLKDPQFWINNSSKALPQLSLQPVEGFLSLPVTYKGEELELPFKVAAQGFVVRYIVEVEEVEVNFEKDDSGDLRAVIYDEGKLHGRLPERGLVKAITEVLKQLIG